MAILYETIQQVPDYTEYLERGSYTQSRTRALASGPAYALREHLARRLEAMAHAPPADVSYDIMLSEAEERRSREAGRTVERRARRLFCAREGLTWTPGRRTHAYPLGPRARVCPEPGADLPF